jgi:hypothetical protein
MDNTAAMLRVLERLYRVPGDPGEDNPGATEFLRRMSWLPVLIRDLGRGRARLDA